MSSYDDQFKDTPANREQMKRAAEVYADVKGVVYVVIRDKGSGQLGVQPKSSFDPTTDEIVFECDGGGERAADERWQKIIHPINKFSFRLFLSRLFLSLRAAFRSR
jgi:hypothetical protein